MVVLILENYLKELVMDEDDITKLFSEDKILVRAMDEPPLQKNDNGLFYNFSTWAEEVDIAKNDRLTSLSTTLLVAGEKIPTYKNMGFLVNSEKAEIIHVSAYDSGSSGNIIYDNFTANSTDLKSLSDLVIRTRLEKLKDMNEVNVAIKDEAIIGLFVNKCYSERPKAKILLAQEYYKLQTGKKLPIFTYDSHDSSLIPLKMRGEEKKDFLEKMHKSKVIYSSVIGYELYSEYTQENKYTDVLKRKDGERDKKFPLNDRFKHLRGISVSDKISHTIPKKEFSDLQIKQNIVNAKARS